MRAKRAQPNSPQVKHRLKRRKGSSILREANGLNEAFGGVGERCAAGEVRAEALVDAAEVRMPE